MEASVLFSRVFAYYDGICRRVATGPRWRIKVAIFACLLNLFACFPRIDMYFHPENHFGEVVQLKVESPFRDMSDFPPDSNEAKRTFRITVPVFAHLLHLGLAPLIVLNFLAQILILVAALRWGEKLFSSRMVAVYICLFMASIYVGFGAFGDWYYQFDSVAYLLLMLALLSRNAWLNFALVLAASFSDERALICSPMIILCHTILRCRRPDFAWKDLLHGQTYATVAAWVSYLAGRYYLAVHLGCRTSLDGFFYLNVLGYVRTLPLAFWSGLEAGWLVVVWALVVAFRQARRISMILWLGSLMVSLTVAFMVGDVTRSIAYVFPSFFIALAILKHAPTDEGGLEKTLMAVSFVSLFFLNVQVLVGINQYLPMPVQLIHDLYVIRQF